jgi:VanZ family protein
MRSGGFGPFIRWLPVPIWMAFIFLMSSQSRPPVAIPDYQLLLSKTAHVVMYALLGGLFYGAIRPRTTGGASSDRLAADSPGNSRSQSLFGRSVIAAVVAVVFAAAYGATDEFHQVFVPGRHPLASDVGIDSAGAALGVAMSLGLLWCRDLALVLKSRS